MSENFAEQREQPATGQDFRDISLIVDEIESMFNRKIMQFLYMQLGISLALFSALFTALYFSLSPR